jgi:endoglucanase
LGSGVGIKIMDASTICDSRMVKFMKKTATENKISWQNEILTAGGTDTASIQRMTPGGSIAGAFSIPTRHIHQVIEMVHKKDVESCIDLLKWCLLSMKNNNWEHKNEF